MQIVVVVNIPLEIWKKISNHYKKYIETAKLTASQMNILYKMSIGKLMPPTERQSKILYKILEKAREEGVIEAENSGSRIPETDEFDISNYRKDLWYALSHWAKKNNLDGHARHFLCSAWWPIEYKKSFSEKQNDAAKKILLKVVDLGFDLSPYKL